jgi:hypothetical protein
MEVATGRRASGSRRELLSGSRGRDAVTWPDREQLKDATIKIIIFVLFTARFWESWT